MSKDDSSIGEKEFRLLGLMILFSLKYYFYFSKVLVILAMAALILGTLQQFIFTDFLFQTIFYAIGIVLAVISLFLSKFTDKMIRVFRKTIMLKEVFKTEEELLDYLKKELGLS